MTTKKIGILALQGAFEEHKQMLQSLGAQITLIRNRFDWSGSLDGLILPGGESTVMGKLLRECSLFDEISAAIADGLPTFGTCAGLILLAKKIEGESISHFGHMDILCKRNAYGRQLGSFSAVSSFNGCGEIPMVFIRAPIIEKWGPSVQPLAKVNGKVVAARQGHMLVTAFHPELTDCLAVHTYFIKEMIEDGKKAI